MIEMFVLVASILIFVGIIWGTISYCKACAYYYYNPVNAIDCPLAFASIALPIAGIAFANALLKSSEGTAVLPLVIMISVSSLIAGIGLCIYFIRRGYQRTGSWKFALASYPIEIFITYLGLFTMGLFFLGARVLVEKLK